MRLWIILQTLGDRVCAYPHKTKEGADAKALLERAYPTSHVEVVEVEVFGNADAPASDEGHPGMEPEEAKT